MIAGQAARMSSRMPGVISLASLYLRSRAARGRTRPARPPVTCLAVHDPPVRTHSRTAAGRLSDALPEGHRAVQRRILLGGPRGMGVALARARPARADGRRPAGPDQARRGRSEGARGPAQPEFAPTPREPRHFSRKRVRRLVHTSLVSIWMNGSKEPLPWRPARRRHRRRGTPRSGPYSSFSSNPARGSDR